MTPLEEVQVKLRDAMTEICNDNEALRHDPQMFLTVVLVSVSDVIAEMSKSATGLHSPLLRVQLINDYTDIFRSIIREVINNASR